MPRYCAAMTAKPAYHHGDLRNALIASGIRLLEKQGLHALSLRAVAADAGVSHAAPAHHFGNLSGLLTEIAIIGFTRFRKSMQDARDRAPDNPRAALQAISEGYVDFARQNPELFKLMFSGAELDRRNEELKRVGTAAYRELRSTIAPIAAARGVIAPEAVGAMELSAWSFVHGYAHLLISGQLSPMCGPDGTPPPMPDFAGPLTG